MVVFGVSPGVGTLTSASTWIVKCGWFLDVTPVTSRLSSFYTQAMQVLHGYVSVLSFYTYWFPIRLDPDRVCVSCRNIVGIEA
jgi:hypothetical protein